MAEAVSNAVRTEKNLIVEAGTGIGKTLAYLIPAVRWSIDNDERCVVSTYTINLQEQIMNKDIPFLKSALDVDFKAVLIKGRNNYVCLRKVDTEIREMPDLLIPEEKEELKSLLEWARLTKSGDKSELTVTPKAENWERVCCEADTCIRAKCPFYEKCFLVRARREAAISNILIVNHHLLFADIYVRSKVGQFNDIAILPPYSRLILDEAHHIEDVATDYFGLEVARGGIIRLMGRIYSERRTGESKGVISLLRTKLILKNRGGLKKKITPVINIIEDKIIPQKNVINSLSDDVFDSIAQVVRFGNGKNSESRKRRIKKDVTDSEIWINTVIPGIKTLQKNLRGFKKMLKELKESLDTLPRGVYKDFEDRIIELYAQHDRVGELQQKLQSIFITDEPGRVKWIETANHPKGKRIAVHSAPLDVAPDLEESLFKQFKTILLTSATLTVNRKFDYIKKRIGAENILPHRFGEVRIKSPFEYDKQVMIGIPTDLPAVNEDTFAENVQRIIYRSMSLSKGRALVLFTSYKMLNDLYERLREPLAKNLKINTMKQGDYSRSYLLDYFRSDETSALFATDSFWEGIDVEGSALESIIIVRLPFRVPTEPVIEARTEAINKSGGNAFMEYSVPQAVIKLKQGFGRLIRRKTDRGFILILDKRIVEKFYGKIFLNSLPDCKVSTGNLTSVFKELKKFYNN